MYIDPTYKITKLNLHKQLRQNGNIRQNSKLNNIVPFRFLIVQWDKTEPSKYTIFVFNWHCTKRCYIKLGRFDSVVNMVMKVVKTGR